MFPEESGTVNRVYDILEKKEKKIHEKNSFYKNLMLRCVSKPIPRNSRTIEFSRKIVQLVLLCYNSPLKRDSIKAILHYVTRKRYEIKYLMEGIRNIGIEENDFILFCYWYLKTFPDKFYKSINWILSYNELSLVAYAKYRTNTLDYQKELRNYAMSKSSGIKLMKLIGAMEKRKKKIKDDVYEKLINL